MSAGDFTVKTVDTANALLLAASRVATTITALKMILAPLPEGTTMEVIDVAIIKLREASHALEYEGNQLNRLGDSS